MYRHMSSGGHSLTSILAARSKTRNDKPEQHWYLKDGASKILLADSTLCLDGGAKSEPAPAVTKRGK
jgi:hypothetical protein